MVKSETEELISRYMRHTRHILPKGAQHITGLILPNGDPDSRDILLASTFKDRVKVALFLEVMLQQVLRESNPHIFSFKEGRLI